MDFDWKGIVKTIAPVLGTALGGPLAGGATKMIADALLGDENASEEDIVKFMQGATPDQLTALKQVENDFKLKMKELDIKEDELVFKDRDSARNREIKTKDFNVPVIAYITLAGFFGTVAFMLTMSPEVSAITATLVGYVSAKAEQVISYYFGSSAGSKEKNHIINSLRNN